MFDKSLGSFFDAIPDHVAILDDIGKIVFSNAAWNTFGIENGLITASANHPNYIDTCHQAAATGNQDARAVIDGFHHVLSGTPQSFYYEYPCHSPTQQRWFKLKMHQVRCNDGTAYVLLAHEDTTDSVLTRQALCTAALTDELTGLANTRSYRACLDREWRRDRRNHKPLSMLFVDVDYFKQFNDLYGHRAGDHALKQVASIVQRYARRPGDLAVRYGGEEFLLLLGSTTNVTAEYFAESIRNDCETLQIPHAGSTNNPVLTVSIGVTSIIPDAQNNSDQLFSNADLALYQAKHAGRNTVRAKYILPV